MPSAQAVREAWKAHLGGDFAKGWHEALASGVVAGTASPASDVRRAATLGMYTPWPRRCGAHRAVPPGSKPVGRSFRQQCLVAGTAAAADQAGVGQSATYRTGPCQANAARKWGSRAFGDRRGEYSSPPSRLCRDRLPTASPRYLAPGVACRDHRERQRVSTLSAYMASTGPVTLRKDKGRAELATTVHHNVLLETTTGDFAPWYASAAFVANPPFRG